MWNNQNIIPLFDVYFFLVDQFQKEIRLCFDCVKIIRVCVWMIKYKRQQC